MAKLKETVWGRNVTLDVDYDVAPGERPSAEQTNAYVWIMVRWDFVDAALPQLKEYLQTAYADKLDVEVEDVFEYVTPKRLHMGAGELPLVSLICDLSLDPDKGVALSFQDLVLQKVGPVAEVVG